LTDLHRTVIETDDNFTNSATANSARGRSVFFDPD